MMTVRETTFPVSAPLFAFCWQTSNCWCSVQPRPERRAIIEAEIQRTDTQTKAITRLIERLEKDATTLVAQSLQGELATPILGLIAKRDENLANLITQRNSLNGVSRDVIFGKPDLPQEASWPNRGVIVILQ